MSKNPHRVCAPTLSHIKASCLGSPTSQIVQRDGLGETVVLGIGSTLSCSCILWAPAIFHIILRVVQHCYNIVQTVAIMWVYPKCSTVIMCNKFPT